MRVMKDLHLILIWCAAACLLLSCSDESNIIPLLEIQSNGSTLNNASITFDRNGSNIAIEILSNVQWKIGCEAEWLTISPREGEGNGEVLISADATSAARSAVVVVYLSDYNQVRHTFNIIQQGPITEPTPDSGEDNPTDNPDNEEDGNDNEGEDGDGDGDGDDNDDDENDTSSGEDGEGGNGGNNTPSEDDDPNNNGEGGTTPITPPAGEDNEQDKDTTKEYSRITTTAKLTAGTYYLGGYQDTTLHLAVEGISNGHCHTATYLYDDKSGTLTPQQSVQAIEVTLEAAEGTDSYYIHFAGEGYLYATDNSAGKLTFSEEPYRAWQFTTGEDGFIVTQDDALYVKLVISKNAIDRVLRSIDGYEKGNPIVLFRKN